MDVVTLAIALQLAKKMIEGLDGFDYGVCRTAETTPYGISFVKDGTTITGTLVASASTMHKIYLVPKSNGTGNYFDEYITVEDNSSYTWEKFGSTEFVQQTLVCEEVNHEIRISLE